jgi:predicted nicotinamide N-methyase
MHGTFTTRYLVAANQPRAPPPLLKEATGLGDHDIYGFEPTELPPLPSGERLTIHLGDDRVWEPSSDADENDNAALWKKYVCNFDAGYEDDEEAAGIGGEIWPAAVAMCDFLANHTDAVRGARVLELGCGTGACGLYAAALGASRVLLSDGGSSALCDLIEVNIEGSHRAACTPHLVCTHLTAVCALCVLQVNIEANRHLYSPDARVELVPLRWGLEADGGSSPSTFADALTSLRGESDGGDGKVDDVHTTATSTDAAVRTTTPTGAAGRGALDWVIASDVTYGHEAYGSESKIIGSLCHTMGSLLRSGGSRASGCGAAADAGSPSVEEEEGTEGESIGGEHGGSSLEQKEEEAKEEEVEEVEEVVATARPRILLAHEHRARDCGLPWLQEELSSWDEGDEHLASLQHAARAEGLALRPLWSQRPECVQRGELRSWTADLSVFEVVLASSVPVED